MELLHFSFNKLLNEPEMYLNLAFFYLKVFYNYVIDFPHYFSVTKGGEMVQIATSAHQGTHDQKLIFNNYNFYKKNAHV